MKIYDTGKEVLIKPHFTLAKWLAGLLIMTMFCGPKFSSNPPRTLARAFGFTTNGVPAVDPDYAVDVESWWANHPLNPDNPSGIAIGGIQSPTPIIDVQAQFNGDIQAAIDSLPNTGGSLKLAPGTYREFTITAKSNIHFLGDNQNTVFLKGGYIWGCQEATDYASFNLKLHEKDPAAVNCVINRPHNFYFKNLTFDGTGKTATAQNNTAYGEALFMRAIRDVVFDSVTFQNFPDSYPSSTWHTGTVSGNGIVDNVWCRNCQWTPTATGRYAWFIDGPHGSGVISSTFQGSYGSGTILNLTNDDFTEDSNGNEVFDLSEQRVPQYNVYTNNIFDAYVYEIFALNGMQALVKNNTVKQYVYRFGRFTSRCSNRWYQNGLVYEMYGDKLIANNTQDITYFVEWEGVNGTWCSGDLVEATNYGRLGKYTVSHNTIQNAPRFTALSTELPPVDGPNTVCDNTINGSLDQSCSNQTFLPLLLQQ